MDDEVRGIDLPFLDRRDGLVQALRIVPSPARDLLFLHEGQREENTVVTDGPDKLEGLLCVGPLRDGVLKEEVIGFDGDVSSSVDRSVDVVRKIPND